jgi:hypothetical protein
VISHFETNDLIRIANAGGGFELSATGRDVNDIIRIANAAGGKGRIDLTGAGHLGVNDIIRIANAGKGSVFFK